jgi:hypothetical protein
LTPIIQSGEEPEIKTISTTHPTNWKIGQDLGLKCQRKSEQLCSTLKKVFKPNEMSQNEELEK